jgi:hypothetical protein
LAEPRLLREPRRTSILLSVVAHAILLPAILVGVLAVIHAPMFLAAGFPFEKLGAELNRVFNYGQWHTLMTKLLVVLSIILLSASAVALLIARREAGGLHMIRSLLGAFGLFLAGLAAYAGFDRLNWLGIANSSHQRDFGTVIELVVNGAESVPLMWALGLCLVSATILAWPERRRLIGMKSVYGGGSMA